MQEKNIISYEFTKVFARLYKHDKIAIILDGLAFGFYTLEYEYYKQIF